MPPLSFEAPLRSFNLETLKLLESCVFNNMSET